MSYKNSLKLLTSNFALVWKQLAFVLVTLAISLLLSILVATPTINLLSAEGWFDRTKALFEAVYVTPNELNETAKGIVVSFFDIITSHFGGYFLSYIAFILTSVFVPMFLLGISEYTLCVLSSNILSSNVTLGYTNTMLTNFKSSSLYSLIKIVTNMVCYLIVGLIFGLYLKFAKGIVLTIILLMLLVAIVVAVFSFKLTFLSHIVSRMVEEPISTRKCVAKAFKVPSTHFWRTFSGAIIINLTIIAANLFFGVFTVFAGLLLTIPASMVLTALFMMTNYYNHNGKKYYLTPSLIVEPIVVETKDNVNKK